ncbi:SPW repeat protein [Nonomuraea jiangxiensis]|uniref:SPW repeat-containing protein n=1 Tax=Nonomuraea jiangxiensis TaxID=633440 RepID=A0A1G9J232_9ACTN|nr:SPW repeat protein [Nonomuraea jiangxiensis]SDL31519.1 SPW repeat-containing protein [Nonomuraea jiangxiensis]
MAGETMRMHPDIAELRAKYELAAETPIAKAVAGLTFLTGLYLAISPWVVGFNGFTTLTVNNLIVGIALAMLGAGFASASGRTHGIVWIAPLIGVWTIIAPWVVSGNVATTGTIWSNVVTGAVAVLLGLAAMLGMNRPFGSPMRRR